jgi:hypothetical protein
VSLVSESFQLGRDTNVRGAFTPYLSDEQAYKYVSALEAGQLSVPWDSIAAGGQLDEPMVLPLTCILPASLEKR